MTEDAAAETTQAVVTEAASAETTQAAVTKKVVETKSAAAKIAKAAETALTQEEREVIEALAHAKVTSKKSTPITKAKGVVI